MSNPISGAYYLLRGFGLLFKPGIRPYVIIPLLINTIIFISLIIFGVQQFQEFLDWIMPDLPEWLQWLSWLMWIIFGIGALLIVVFTFSLVSNLVGAPFNALLATAVEKHITGGIQKAGSSDSIVTNSSFIANIIPALANEVKKIAYAIAWSIPFLILFLIPVVNLAAPFLWFMFTAWMLAIEYADYPMGNHDILFPTQRRYLRSQTLKTMGFGSAVGIATMIPIANFMVMPAAVAGATIYWCEQLKHEDKSIE